MAGAWRRTGLGGSGLWEVRSRGPHVRARANHRRRTRRRPPHQSLDRWVRPTRWSLRGPRHSCDMGQESAILGLTSTSHLIWVRVCGGDRRGLGRSERPGRRARRLLASTTAPA